MDVVLIHLGSRVPAYVRTGARQIQAVAGRPPLVVGPLRGARYRGGRLARFRATEALTDMGLGGFWRYSAERFFVLEQHMRATGIDRCLHVEGDCLLYAAPSEYDRWLTDVYGESLAICPLTADEDTAAVMYVGSLRALSAFNEALLELVALAPARLLELHGGPMANEMRMIRLARDAGLAQALPTTVAQAQTVGSTHVFDPASYGQFVDGTPDAPGVSYASDHHEVGRELLRGNYRIVWNAQQHAPLVVAREEQAEYPLANLHVHSKRLDRWLTEVVPPAPPRPTLGSRVDDQARALLGGRLRAVRRRLDGRTLGRGRQD